MPFTDPHVSFDDTVDAGPFAIVRLVGGSKQMIIVSFPHPQIVDEAEDERRNRAIDRAKELLISAANSR